MRPVSKTSNLYYQQGDESSDGIGHPQAESTPLGTPQKDSSKLSDTSSNSSRVSAQSPNGTSLNVSTGQLVDIPLEGSDSTFSLYEVFI